MQKSRGFSLIELLIVVAVILILAAITVPSLLRSRLAANEASAAASVRSISTAQIAYISTYDHFATTLSQLSIPAPGTEISAEAAGFIDATLASKKKQGYTFDMTGSSTGFAVSAVPDSPGMTGIRSFCANEKNAVSAAPTGNPGDCKPGVNPL